MLTRVIKSICSIRLAFLATSDERNLSIMKLDTDCDTIVPLSSSLPRPSCQRNLEGATVGASVGYTEGFAVGETVGDSVGAIVGESLGDIVGA